ncbi:RNA polymerase sigma factor [Chitinophaga lutea]
MTRSHYQLKDDIELWTLLRNGDREAFVAIYNRYFPLLFRYCSSFTSDRPLVKDMLQDFFTQLYLQSATLHAAERLKSYLLVSARRKLIRYLGKASRFPDALTDEDTYDFCLELSAESAWIDRQRAEEHARCLRRSVARLTDRQREAIYLRFYESLGYEEIAEVMQLKEVKYARTLIYRALGELKTVLAKDAGVLSYS